MTKDQLNKRLWLEAYALRVFVGVCVLVTVSHTNVVSVHSRAQEVFLDHTSGSSATVLQGEESLSLPSLTENYLFQALNQYKSKKDHPSYGPLETVDLYIEQHSQQALDKESNEDRNRRSFVVGAYACPHYAGRRLHTFMNGLIIAIVTNRTFLYYYMDDKECHLEEKEWGASDCNWNNTKLDCDDYLQIMDWMPRWEQWKEELSLAPPIRANFFQRDPWARPYDQAGSPRVITVGQLPNLAAGVDLTRSLQRQKLLDSTQNRKVASKLFWMGYYFAYGMIQEAMFTLKQHDTHQHNPNPETHKTFAMHSRLARNHLRVTYDGLESTCIQQLNSTLADTNHSVCVVYLMVDKSDKCASLEQQIYAVGCIPKRLTHHHLDDRAYFRDWIFLRDHARHGFLSPHQRRRPGIGMRPSSALVRESIEFRRILDGHAPDTVPHECFEGYDWGEGMKNCTRMDQLASSYGIERYYEIHGPVVDPCVWAWRNRPDKHW